MAVKTTKTVEQRRARLERICTALPEAESTGSGRAGEHMTFTVAGKKFGYYLFDHHGDGIVAFSCKAAPGDQDALLRMDPVRFLIPAYMGRHGWISMRLDTPSVDWAQVEDLARTAWRLLAPKRLTAAQIKDQRSPGKGSGR